MQTNIEQFLIWIWQFMSNNALFAAVIGAIPTSFGYFLVERRRKKTAEAEGKLKNHFEDLVKDIKSVISSNKNISGVNGQVLVKITSSYGDIISHDTSFEFPKFSYEFDLHFPTEAGEYNKIIEKIQEHNKAYNQLGNKIKSEFISKGFNVVNANQAPNSTCIYENIVSALFQWWKSLSQGNIGPDFNKITNPPDRGDDLCVEGWGAAIAYAQSEQNKEICREAIIKIAKKDEYHVEAIKLINSANEIVKELQDFDDKLTKKVDNIRKYGMDKEFKRIKKCPICAKF
jgi:hypothetical protein